MGRLATAIQCIVIDDYSVWEAAALDEAQRKANITEEQQRLATEIQKRREEIKQLSISGK